MVGTNILATTAMAMAGDTAATAILTTMAMGEVPWSTPRTSMGVIQPETAVADPIEAAVTKDTGTICLREIIAGRGGSSPFHFNFTNCCICRP